MESWNWRNETVSPVPRGWRAYRASHRPTDGTDMINVIYRTVVPTTTTTTIPYHIISHKSTIGATHHGVAAALHESNSLLLLYTCQLKKRNPNNQIEISGGPNATASNRVWYAGWVRGARVVGWILGRWTTRRVIKYMGGSLLTIVQ